MGMDNIDRKRGENHMNEMCPPSNVRSVRMTHRCFSAGFSISTSKWLQLTSTRVCDMMKNWNEGKQKKTNQLNCRFKMLVLAEFPCDQKRALWLSCWLWLCCLTAQMLTTYNLGLHRGTLPQNKWNFLLNTLQSATFDAWMFLFVTAEDRSWSEEVFNRLWKNGTKKEKQQFESSANAVATCTNKKGQVQMLFINSCNVWYIKKENCSKSQYESPENSF